MTTAINSHGTLLRLGDGATPTEAFTTIAQVLDISLPAPTTQFEETTNHSSAGYVERMASIVDSGEVSFDVNWIPTDSTHDPATGLWADMVAKTLRHFSVTLTEGSSMTFSAYVASVAPSAPVVGPYTASVTLQITGAVTLTEAV